MYNNVEYNGYNIIYIYGIYLFILNMLLTPEMHVNVILNAFKIGRKLHMKVLQNINDIWMIY